MDHSPKCKTRKHKTFRLKKEKNLCDLGLGRILMAETKSAIHGRQKIEFY